MTQLIHIDANTNPNAVRRRLARLPQGQVAVVLPSGWGELDSLARLRLLQRQARIRSQHLALVTRDHGTRAAARKLGIPVYSSEAAAMGRSWRSSSELPAVDPQNPAANLPHPPPWRAHGNGRTKVVQQVDRPNLYRGRQRRIRAEERYRRPTPLWLRTIGYAFFVLFVALFLGAFAFYVLPAATVTVVPGQRQTEAAVQLLAAPGVEINTEEGLIPARLMEQYVELTGTLVPTGSEEAPVAAATGTIFFTNQTNRAIRIPAGTIISTNTGERIDFRTLSEITVPGPRGTRASVAIEAVDPGVEGNVRANIIATVSGALSTQVQATNLNPTAGGQSEQVRVVKQRDQDLLLEQVYAEAQEAAVEELRPALRPGEWLPPQAVQTFVVSQFFDHFNDEPADELTLSLRVLVRGVAIDQEVAQRAALDALEDAVPEGAKLVADSLQYLADTNATVEGNSVRFRVVARGNYVIPIDAARLRNSITGLPQERASAVLQEEWLLASPPEFYQDPDWFGRLPQIGRRIQVRVAFAEAQ